MQVYISLGTNLGDKEQNLNEAVRKIEERIGHVVSLSAFHVTAPWGFHSHNSFLNAALCVETTLEPLELLERTQSIECEIGRTHKSVDGIYHDRLIDIDLLLCGDVIMQNDRLTLPHPHLAERLFVLEPLEEIAPQVVHPLLNITIQEILLNCRLKND